jgi:hypothetical protein
MQVPKFDLQMTRAFQSQTSKDHYESESKLSFGFHMTLTYTVTLTLTLNVAIGAMQRPPPLILQQSHRQIKIKDLTDWSVVQLLQVTTLRLPRHVPALPASLWHYLLIGISSELRSCVMPCRKHSCIADRLGLSVCASYCVGCLLMNMVLAVRECSTNVSFSTNSLGPENEVTESTRFRDVRQAFRGV